MSANMDPNMFLLACEKATQDMIQLLEWEDSFEELIEDYAEDIYPKVVRNKDLTAFESAMIQLAEKRTDHLIQIAVAQLGVMKRILKDNISYHSKMLKIVSKKE